MWAKVIESESEKIKKTGDFRPLDGVTHQYSGIVSAVRLAGQEFKPFRSNFPPVHGARIYDDSPFSEKPVQEPPRPSSLALRHRLIAIETIRSRENFLADVQFGKRESRFRQIVGKLGAKI